MSGPPSECPPQTSLRCRLRCDGIPRVMTVCQSSIVCFRPTSRRNAASCSSAKPGKRLPVHLAALEVVAERHARVARLHAGAYAAVVLEAVRAAVDAPDLDVAAALRRAPDRVARDLVERAAAGEDPRHQREHRVRAGGARAGRRRGGSGGTRSSRRPPHGRARTPASARTGARGTPSPRPRPGAGVRTARSVRVSAAAAGTGTARRTTRVARAGRTAAQCDGSTLESPHEGCWARAGRRTAPGRAGAGG